MTAIRAYAPGRVNLIGEHTDYNRGYALPVALQVGTVVEYQPEPGSATLTAVSEGQGDAVVIDLDTTPGDVTGWGAYVAGCVWALRTAGRSVTGGRISIRSDLPLGAGLSSSHSLECAVLLALDATQQGGPADRHTIAHLAQRVEHAYLGAPTGLLDQLAILYGEPDTAMLIDFDTLAVTTVPMRIPGDGGGGPVELLVIDSCSPHRHAAGEYAERRDTCMAAADLLEVPSLRYARPDAWRALPPGAVRRRARHVLTENDRVLLAARALADGDAAALGRLMTASHASMRDDFEITTPAIDRIVEAALGLGALGARMTGGGFGGSVVAIVPAGAVDGLRADLPGTVGAAGYPRPVVHVIRAGAGAHLR